jgi:hypothetical protein
MSLDDTLASLATSAEHFPPPDLGQVRHRARGIRRGRRVIRAGAAVSVLTGAAVVASVVAAPSRSPDEAPFALGLLSVPAVSAAEAARCGSENSTRAVPGSEVPELTYSLRDTAKAGEARPAFGRRIDSGCTLVAPAAVGVEARGDGTVVRALTVWGPDAVPRGGKGNRPGRVRGTSAAVRGSAAEGLEIAWREPDGTRWVATASGFGESDVLAAVTALRLTGGAVDAASLPRGLRAVPSTAPSPGSGSYWFAGYGYGGKTLQVTATDRRSGPIEELASRSVPERTALVEVAGARGLYTAGSGGSACVVWDASAVARLQVCGRFDRTSLVAFAEDVRLVAPEG